MERLNLTSLIVRRWWVILVLTAIVFGAAVWMDGKKAPKYFGSMAVTVQASRHYPSTNNLILQAGQAADTQNAVATTQAWVTDPFYTSQALSAVGIATDQLSLKDLSKTFQVVSTVALSSSYQVQYTGTSQDEVSKVFSSLRSVLTATQTEYNAKQSDLSIALDFSDPTVTTQSSGVPLVPIAGLLIGLVFGFVVAALIDHTRA
jgi:hypothetical protein